MTAYERREGKADQQGSRPTTPQARSGDKDKDENRPGVLARLPNLDVAELDRIIDPDTPGAGKRPFSHRASTALLIGVGALFVVVAVQPYVTRKSDRGFQPPAPAAPLAPAWNASASQQPATPTIDKQVLQPSIPPVPVSIPALPSSIPPVPMSIEGPTGGAPSGATPLAPGNRQSQSLTPTQGSPPGLAEVSKGPSDASYPQPGPNYAQSGPASYAQPAPNYAQPAPATYAQPAPNYAQPAPGTYAQPAPNYAQPGPGAPATPVGYFGAVGPLAPGVSPAGAAQPATASASALPIQDPRLAQLPTPSAAGVQPAYPTTPYGSGYAQPSVPQGYYAPVSQPVTAANQAMALQPNLSSAPASSGYGAGQVSAPGAYAGRAMPPASSFNSPPAAEPGVARFQGVIEKSTQRPYYDPARPRLY